MQCRVPSDAPQEEDAVGIVSMLGEPQQLVSDGVVDVDGCHQVGFVGHLSVDSQQCGLEEWEDCQGPVDMAHRDWKSLRDCHLPDFAKSRTLSKRL